MARAFASFFRSPAGTPTPNSFRYVFAALSGAALSFSFTGLYLSIYSYVCIGILLIVIFGAKPLVAFICGGLHMLFYIVTSVPWIVDVLNEHGGIPKIAGWGLVVLIGLQLGLLCGGFAWCVNRLAQRSILLACVGAPFLWVTLEFVKEHFPEISFPWGLLGYSPSSNLGLLQITTLTGIYGLSFFAACNQCDFRVVRCVNGNSGSYARDRSRFDARAADRDHSYRSATGAERSREPLRSRRAAEFSRGQRLPGELVPAAR